MYERERLELAIRFSPIDAILFAILLFWAAILSSELADVQKVIHEIQTEARL
jgi:hypothetical protein